MFAVSRNGTSVTSLEWTRVFSSRWMLAFILALTFIAYAPTLDDWFVDDDFWFLQSAQTERFDDYAQRVFDVRETGSLPELNRYRPLYPLAMKAQYELFGLDPMPYHAIQITAHLGAVVLGWFVFRRLLDEAWAANLATFVFALHPIHAPTVAWVTSNRVFAGLLYIAAFLLFLKSRDEGERLKWAWYAGSLCLYIGAILMHSSATTLALALPLYVFLVERRLKDAAGWRAWGSLAPFLLVAAFYALVQVQARDEAGIEQAFQFGWHQFSIYARLFGIFALPIETLDQGSRGDNIVEKAQLLAATAFLFLGFAIFYRRPMWGIAVFGWLWFLLSLLPDSTYIGGASGRMLYLPGFAGALVAVLFLVYVRDSLPESTRTGAIKAAPYVLVAAVIPVVLFSFARTRGVSDDATRYEEFAAALRREVGDVPSGGTLYIENPPRSGPFTPDSVIVSLVGLYYPTSNVVVLAPGDAPSTREHDDRVFQYRP